MLHIQTSDDDVMICKELADLEQTPERGGIEWSNSVIRYSYWSIQQLVKQ